MTPKGLATRRTSARREAPLQAFPGFGLVGGCIGLPPPNGNAPSPATCTPCRGPYFLCAQKVSKDAPGRRKISISSFSPDPSSISNDQKGLTPFGFPAALKIRGISFCMGFLQGNVRSPAHPQIYACGHSRPQGQASLVRGHDRKNNTPMQTRTRVGCGFASALCYRWPLLRTSSPLHTHAPLVAHDSQWTSCASHMRQHVTACDTRTHFRQPAKPLTFPKPETARNGASRRVDVRRVASPLGVIDPYGAGAPLRRVCVIRCRDKHCLSAVTTFKTQYADANSYPGGLRICIGVVLSLAPAADERCSPLHTDTHLGRYTGPLLPTSGARSYTR